MFCCLIPGTLSVVVLFVGSATKGETMEECNFCLLPQFEECSLRVNVNSELIFEECHGTNFPISTFAGLNLPWGADQLCACFFWSIKLHNVHITNKHRATKVHTSMGS
jgi:hypothetical protein